MGDEIKLFDGKHVRTLWDADKETWYFSVVDVVAVLTDNDTPLAAFEKSPRHLVQTTKTRMLL